MRDVIIVGLINTVFFKVIVWLFVESLSYELVTSVFKVRNSAGDSN